MKNKRLNVRLSDEEFDKLKKRSEEVGETISVVIRQTIRESLPTHISAISTPPKRRA
jgi:predicted DNA-binding protein